MPNQATTAIHGAGHAERRPGSPVVSPITQSSTFFWGGPADGDLRYTRYANNPNHLDLARKVAALEATEDAMVMASGMGATSMTFLALARAGEHIVASTHLYGATVALLRDELPRRGIDVTFVDPFLDGTAALAAAIRPDTRVIHIELPTNPTLRILDPRPVAEFARKHGAALTCDATFASPAVLRPAALGVDLVIQSATKYLGGHSDLIAGTVAGSKEMIAAIRGTAKLYGPSLDPHATWLLDRGLRTLCVRMERHGRNALELARWFEMRKGVGAVVYPGLPDHPDHALATELMNGYGGMLGIVLTGGAKAADRFLDRLRVAVAAPSLGGVETLVSQPRHTSHADLSREDRDGLGVPDGFVRISVGIEDVEDLKRDFARALTG